MWQIWKSCLFKNCMTKLKSWRNWILCKGGGGWWVMHNITKYLSIRLSVKQRGGRFYSMCDENVSEWTPPTSRNYIGKSSFNFKDEQGRNCPEELLAYFSWNTVKYPTLTQFNLALPNIYTLFTLHLPNTYLTFTHLLPNIYLTFVKHLTNIYPTFTQH